MAEGLLDLLFADGIGARGHLNLRRESAEKLSTIESVGAPNMRQSISLFGPHWIGSLSLIGCFDAT
jgi:hypothetical protein